MQRRPSRRPFLALGATALLVVGTAVGGPAASAADPVVINLVTINDFHGRIENDPNSAAAGIASLATAVDQIRAANPNTVFAAAGDLVGASTFTSFIQQDAPTIAGLTSAGLDVSSVGNHEFDRGWADLRDRIQPSAGWQYLAANLHDRTTGAPIMPEYWVTEFDGVRVGFIGAVTNELPSLVSPAGIADVVVSDVADNVNRVADDLKDGDPANGEADVVVLLVHEGAATTEVASATDPASPFGRIVTQVGSKVNAIVSGHTHLPYNHVIDGRPVISSGQYGERFSDMMITVDRDTKAIASMVNTLHTMKDGTTLRYPEDQVILDTIVRPAQQVAEEKGAVRLGDITADVNRALQPGSDASGAATLVENRGGESTLGNWVADVQLWSAQQLRPNVRIAFMNPGGLRANMTYASSGPTDPDGNVTYREAAAVQPFANTLVTSTLTGAQLKDVLEQQWQPAAASRPFLKLGVSAGFVYTFSPDAGAGSRITGMWLDGEPVDAAATYDVVVNSFLAAGGDNFGAFAQGAGRADTGKVDLESVVQWFEEHPVASPDLAQRAVGIVVAPPADGVAYRPGERVSVSLSSLDFTTTEPAAGTARILLGDAELGSAPVTRELSTGSDLTGTATVMMTLPEPPVGARDASDVLALTVTTDAGTRVPLEISVTPLPAPTSSGTPTTSASPTTAGPSVSATATATAGTGTGLPATGGDGAAAWALLAAGLLLAGGVVLGVSRRRRQG